MKLLRSELGHSWVQDRDAVGTLRPKHLPRVPLLKAKPCQLTRQHVYRRVSSLLERLNEAACGDDPKASTDALRDVHKVAKEFAFTRPVLEALILHTRSNLRGDDASPSRQHSAPQLQGPKVGG